MTNSEPILERVLQLVQEALDELDRADVSVATVARKAVRIARLRQDWPNWIWLREELVANTDHDARRAIWGEAMLHMTSDEARALRKQFVEEYITERSLYPLDTDMTQQEEKVDSNSLEIIEQKIKDLERLLATASRDEGGFWDWARITQAELMKVAARVRQRIHDFLSRAEADLMLGRVEADPFEENRRYVVARLDDLAPRAGEQLRDAVRYLQVDQPDAESHVALSCRRALKSLADALFPPQSGFGSGDAQASHALTEDKYLNRLWQFVGDRLGNNSAADSFHDELNDLGRRLDTLNAGASKGVHSDLDRPEARQLMVRTFMLVGDILRLATDESASQAEDLNS